MSALLVEQLARDNEALRGKVARLRVAFVRLTNEAEDAFQRFHQINELACREGFVGTELSALILEQAHNSGLRIALNESECRTSPALRVAESTVRA